MAGFTAFLGAGKTIIVIINQWYHIIINNIIVILMIQINICFV